MQRTHTKKKVTHTCTFKVNVWWQEHINSSFFLKEKKNPEINPNKAKLDTQKSIFGNNSYKTRYEGTNGFYIKQKGNIVESGHLPSCFI